MGLEDTESWGGGGVILEENHVNQGMDGRGTAGSVFVGLKWERIVFRHREPVVEEFAQLWCVWVSILVSQA